MTVNNKIESEADIDWFLKEHFQFIDEVADDILRKYVIILIKKHGVTFDDFQKYIDEHIQIHGLGLPKIKVEYVEDKNTVRVR